MRYVVEIVRVNSEKVDVQGMDKQWKANGTTKIAAQAMENKRVRNR